MRADQPTLCMIFEAVGPYNAIGKIAAAEVRAALAAGYRVSVVAHRLDESLRDQVEWLPLYNPPRGFALKWLTARHFIKRSLGGRRFDIVHGHQPQIADLCDVFQCHFLTRVANERDCLVAGRGVAAQLRKWQQQIVIRAEDRYYRRWNPNTWMLYGSDLTRREFHRLYGVLPREEVHLYNSPRLNPVTLAERRAARVALLGRDVAMPVVGYLGGVQERKGYRRLLDAMGMERELFLLMGGIHSEQFEAPGLGDRFKAVGRAGDVNRFYAACDVLVVPSLFEPFGLVALEAASRQIPVIATPEVGALPHVLEHKAGLAWDPSKPIAPLIKQILSHRMAYEAGCRSLVEATSSERQMGALLAKYERIVSERPKVRFPVCA